MLVRSTTLLVCAALLRTARGGETSAATCSANFADCYGSQCCTSNVAFGCYRKKGKAFAQCRRKQGDGDGASCVDSDEWLCPGWVKPAAAGASPSSPAGAPAAAKPAAAKPAATPAAVDLSGCTANKQECTTTRCCKGEAYANDPHGCFKRAAGQYAQCRSVRDTACGDGAEWLCPGSWETCVAVGANCLESGCCAKQGLRCFGKNAAWAQCLAPGSCEGRVGNDGREWSCEEIEPRQAAVEEGQRPQGGNQAAKPNNRQGNKAASGGGGSGGGGGGDDGGSDGGAALLVVALLLTACGGYGFSLRWRGRGDGDGADGAEPDTAEALGVTTTTATSARGSGGGGGGGGRRRGGGPRARRAADDDDDDDDDDVELQQQHSSKAVKGIKGTKAKGGGRGKQRSAYDDDMDDDADGMGFHDDEPEPPPAAHAKHHKRRLARGFDELADPVE